MTESRKRRYDLENIGLRKQLQLALKSLKPFQDSYFKGLSNNDIAELAKKSIRLTKENTELQDKIDEVSFLYDEQTQRFCASTTNFSSDLVKKEKEIRQLKENESKKCSLRFENKKGEFVRCLEFITEKETKIKDLTADLKVATETLKLSKYPCEDCRFYSDCDRKGKCRTKTNFVIDEALKKIGENK